MEIKNLKLAIPHLFDSGVTPLLIAPHGVGKTESVKQFCSESDYFLKVINLGTLSDSGDLLGLPNFEKNNKGDDIATRFITPDWINEIINYANSNPDSRAIIYLDEINRARRDILQAIFSLVLEKRIHMIQFPSNVSVIAAMNPNTGDYIVSDISDKAFMDRFCHIKVKPSAKEWIEYAKGTDHNLDLVSFLDVQSELLDSTTEEFSLDEIKPSRRSWSAVSRLLETNPPEEIRRELVSGLVGMTATIAYEEFLKNSEKPIAAMDILDKFSEISHKITGYVTSNRFDLLKKTTDLLTNELKTLNEITKTQYENLRKFLDIIPAENCFSFTHEAYAFGCLFDKMTEDAEFTKKIKEIKKGRKK